MRNKIVAALVAGLLILNLTGCGENKIPEMTDEEMQLLREYTAITLMKYDANNRSRLVDYTYMLTVSSSNAEQQQDSQEPQVPEGMDPVDDTPIVGGPAGGGVSQSSSMEEVLGLSEGVSIVYTGQSLHDTFPEDGSFTITASTGKQLLVLEFVIINASNQDQSIDILSLAPDFRITVNGDYTRKAMLTLLVEEELSDLSVYQGTIPSMGSASTVLVIELDDERAANLSSISLSIKNDSKTYTTPLL